MRCKPHGLACAPNGRCVLCLRAEPAKGRAGRQGDAAPTGRLWAGLGLMVVAMGIGGAYRTTVARRAAGTISADVVPAATASALPPADRRVPVESSARRPTQVPIAEALAMYQASASAAASAAPAPPASPPPAAPEPSPPPRPPVVSLRDVNVVVYSASWCSVCKRAKGWMDAQGIAYEEKDIDLSSENARGLRALNARGSVPTFDVDGDVMVGFSEQGLVATMTRAAQRRAARAL